jgi:hypothetical protein
MKTTALLIACLLATTPALAQDKPASADAATSADKLDLNLPKPAGIYRNDPPGTWYGDTSGVPASTASTETETAATTASREDQCEGQLHGTATVGVGYSSRGGNSNWQALNLRSCKTWYNDDGQAREVGVSISVGKYDGPGGFFGPRSAPPVFNPRR